ncbi:hypothetical protein SES60163_09070 [Salmonella enterica subsp. salamae serovar 58:l,z13,z28:z6 str. 00-0163]|nr:hypothetical protein SES60163_09070 [Salmonella enterica subsp. salamae serovar 58:l,z13,z28:z6 str. 00-0163]
MTFKMSSKAQTIKIFNLRSETNEFIGVGDAYIPQHTELPSHSTDSEPPEIPSGQIAAFEFKKAVWSLTENHRSQTVYRTDTREAFYIQELGPVPENAILVSPDGEYQK